MALEVKHGKLGTADHEHAYGDDEVADQHDSALLHARSQLVDEWANTCVNHCWQTNGEGNEDLRVPVALQVKGDVGRQILETHH